MPREAWQLRGGCSGHGGLMEQLGKKKNTPRKVDLEKFRSRITEGTLSTFLICGRPPQLRPAAWKWASCDS